MDEEESNRDRARECLARERTTTTRGASLGSRGTGCSAPLMSPAVAKLPATPTLVAVEEPLDELEGVFDLECEWEEIPVTMTADSGAGNHIINADDIPGYMVSPSPASIAGKGFVAADNGRIANEGQADLNLAVGKNKLRSTFQVAEVTRPLWSVGKICDQGFEARFTKTKATILDEQGREVLSFERRNGLYLAMIQLRNPKYKPKSTPGFPGPSR